MVTRRLRLGRRQRRFRSRSRRRNGRIGTVTIRPGRNRGCVPFRFELPACDVRLDDHARRIHVRQGDGLPAAQAAVAPVRLVEAVRVAEAVVGPGQESDAVGDGAQQHGWLRQARQVEVTGEVLDDLPDGHVVAAPQRHSVELHLQSRAGEPGRQQIVALQSARRPVRQGALSGQARRFPGDRIGRRGLHRGEQPLVRLRQPLRDRLGGGLPLRLGLLHLVGRQIEQLALLENRLPGQVTADRLVQVLQARLIRGQEHERVAVQARRGPPGFQDVRGCPFRRRAGVAVIRMLGAEHYQAGLPLVRHVVSGSRPRVDAAEAAGVAERRAQPIADRLDHPVRVAP